MQTEERNQTEVEAMDFESKQNLVGFFELLLQVDMRNNPDLYKDKENMK